jgi:hypothetical protein
LGLAFWLDRQGRGHAAVGLSRHDLSGLRRIPVREICASCFQKIDRTKRSFFPNGRRGDFLYTCRADLGLIHIIRMIERGCAVG